MSRTEDRAERQDRLLDEMADLVMDLARDMAAEAKKSQTLDERERCIVAVDRMTRSARLSIALQRRLAREDAREHRARQAEGVDLRKARLRARLRAEIREADYGVMERVEMERELDARLGEDALYQSFLALPLDQALTKLRDKLGLEDPPPQGEGDRVAVEGVETHSRLRGLQPPHPAPPGAPPEGEHLRGPSLKPAPS